MTIHQRMLAPGVSLLLGVTIGFIVRGAMVHEVKKVAFVERREGGFKHVNPLLECDIARDVLSDEEVRPFQRAIEAALRSRVDPASGTRTSVYFRELNDGLWFSIGETERFVPASLRKVPLMIALLKQVERAGGADLLDREVTMNLSRDYNADQNVKPSRALAKGGSYKVRELIQRMIVESDNNAFFLLTGVVDPTELEQVYARLSMLSPNAVGEDDFLTVETYASFFRVLYNASYIGKESSEWALDLLARSEFTAGLVSGVPRGVTVAHKFGEKSDARTGTVQLHDCGIVYYPDHPYLLCVMTQGSSFEKLDDVIREVSRLIFLEMHSQRPRR